MGTLHVKAGDDTWQPTEEEMKRLSELVIAADNDPAGAVIVTRPGVELYYLSDDGTKIPPQRIAHFIAEFKEGEPTSEQLSEIADVIARELKNRS